MSPPTKTDPTLERVEVLMMKAVDDVLTAPEARELDALLADDPARRAELDDHLAIKGDTDMLRTRILDDAAIDPVRASVAGRAAIGLGTTLIAVSALVLSGFAAWQVLTADGLPVWVRGALGAGLAGVLILFLYVVRQRARSVGRDPYTEIDL